MTIAFEKALAERVKEDPSVGILMAQWEFDKKLLSSALQNVGRTFPHYSRHDASHSHSILIQIERVLGAQRIAALSATDLWLLLEAAYLHDSGMIVTNSDLEKIWREEAFLRFLSDLQTHPDPDIREAAALLRTEPTSRLSAPSILSSWPIGTIRAVTLVVAEYRRGQHASKSADVIANPATAGIASPRTGLIQDRLFHLLGSICSSHAQPFDKMLSLPYSECGVANDQAHPRFVASMLRLGDLLDLDNGRFCPVMLATFGKLPSSSEAHVTKHAAVRHLRIDTRTIEVRAECDAEAIRNGGYEACATWFDMLRSELRNQQQAWTKIAPNENFGSLPSEGTIEVHCNELVSHGHVELAPDRVHRFLAGSNLYAGFDSFVRELIQNASDATLVRAWAENQDRFVTPDDIQRVLAEYSIEVTFRRNENSSHGRSSWLLSVLDRGVGFSSEDVEGLRQVGARHGSSAKKLLISRMPEWLRPSGTFGIGMQSLFLVTDRVHIQTRSYFTGESLEIELVRSSNDTRPRVLSKPLSFDTPVPFGSKVEFTVEYDAVPAQFRYPIGVPEVSKVLEDFDFLVTKDLPIEAAKITHKLSEIRASSWTPVTVNGNRPETGSDEKWYFDQITGIRVSLIYQSQRNLPGTCWIRYRGADVEHIPGGLILFDAITDIHSGTADEILTLSREKLKSETQWSTNKKVRAAASRALTARVISLRNTGENQSELEDGSLALLVSPFQEATKSAGTEWGNIVIGRKKSAVSLTDLTKFEEVVLEELSRGSGFNSLDEAVIKVDNDVITISTASTPLLSTLERVLGSAGFVHKQIVGLSRRKNNRIERQIKYLKSPPFDVYENEQLLRELLISLCNSHIGCRRTIPCPAQFTAIALPQDPDGFLVGLESRISPRLLLPFVVGENRKIEIREIGALVSYLETSTKTDKNIVVDSLLSLVEYIDKLMSNVPQWIQDRQYDLAGTMALLRQMRGS